jgi:hypothetical protein
MISASVASPTRPEANAVTIAPPTCRTVTTLFAQRPGSLDAWVASVVRWRVVTRDAVLLADTYRFEPPVAHVLAHRPDVQPEPLGDLLDEYSDCSGTYRPLSSLSIGSNRAF